MVWAEFDYGLDWSGSPYQRVNGDALVCKTIPKYSLALFQSSFAIDLDALGKKRSETYSRLVNNLFSDNMIKFIKWPA